MVVSLADPINWIALLLPVPWVALLVCHHTRKTGRTRKACLLWTLGSFFLFPIVPIVYIVTRSVTGTKTSLKTIIPSITGASDAAPFRKGITGYWDIGPVPHGTGELTFIVNRFAGQEGPWIFTVSLEPSG
jgi:hypothetical protein